MAIIQVGLAVPDLKVLRAEPCSSLVTVETECGATPASLYRRFCIVSSHERKIWLCPIHASLVMTGAATCRECAERGGVSPVMIFRISEPVRVQ